MHQIVNSRLSVTQAADGFRSAGAQLINGKAKLLRAFASMYGHDTNEFFTPDLTKDSFFQVGTRPALALGVARAKVGLYGARAGEQDAGHLYVFDHGEHRELQFFTPHGILGSSGAVKRLARFVAAVVAVDHQAVVSEPVAQ